MNLIVGNVKRRLNYKKQTMAETILMAEDYWESNPDGYAYEFELIK